ncbi:neuronal acetylcholine receptor subunit beta-3-like [Haliotis cracherodii]|uniref:neuronal acetylcholine receptor subunit beta-3-like n=1 Tax=Haliotis cracherodii TaxID=6455 RepID=UPI0039EBCDBC
MDVNFFNVKKHNVSEYLMKELSSIATTSPGSCVSLCVDHTRVCWHQLTLCVDLFGFVMEHLGTVVTLCVYLCGACSLQSSIDQGPVYTLYKDLLEHYKTYIRPRKNLNETVDVLVSYNMAFVEALDENTQSLTSTGFLTLEWTDDLLTWNSWNYGDITNITIPVEKLWIPDLILINGLHEQSLILPNGEMARVKNDGRVTWYKWITRRTNCLLDMRKFPFDTQTCSFKFSQWTSVIYEINMAVDSIKIDPLLSQQNGEWEIVGKSKETIVTSYDEIYIYQEVAFTFVFTRKYLYYIITNILPVMLLSVLNLGMFLLPPESGEKVSLCISIVLSYAVFLSVIGESLPEVSDTVSIFSIYLLAMMFLKVTTTLIIVAILNVYHSDTTKELTCAHASNRTEIESPPDNEHVTEPGNMSERKISTNGNKQLAALLNKIGFCIIFSLTVILTVVCFVLLLKLE